MTSYSNINDAFSAKESEKLDKMARYVNNKINDNNNYSNYRSDCDLYGNNNSTQSLDLSDEFKFYSVQGNIENNSSHSKNSFDFGTTDQSSNHTDPHNKKKYKKYIDDIHDVIKNSHNDDNSYSDNSNSYDDIVKHIKSCYKCRKSVKNKIYGKPPNDNSDCENIMRIDKHNINDVIESSQNISNQNNGKNIVDQNISSQNNDYNMYNIIVALLIGIGIIIILDLLYRSSALNK